MSRSWSPNPCRSSSRSPRPGRSRSRRPNPGRLSSRSPRPCDQLPNLIISRYRHEMCVYNNLLYILGGGTSTTVFGFKTIPTFYLGTHQN